MAIIDTSYLPGAVRTTTSGLDALPGPAPLGGMGQMPDFAGLMRYRMALERQRAADEARLRALQMRQAEQGMEMQRRAFNAGLQPEERPSLSPNEQNLRSRERLAQVTLAEAASRPVPKQLITGGPGIIPGFAPDTTQLPVALLPKAAHLAPSEPQGDSFGEHQRQDQRRAFAATRKSPEDALRQAAQQNAFYGRRS